MLNNQTILCHDCWNAHKKGDWYMSDTYEQSANVEDCLFHPSLTNWRVTRTLKSLKLWSLMGEGYKHKNFSAVRLTLKAGFIHRRTSEAILFDYEKPFIDLLIKEKYLKLHKNHDGVTEALEVLPKADELLQVNLKAELV